MFISGASRGIGLEIARRAARDGANIALIAKTAEPHPKLPGTVFTAAQELEEAGGQALPIVGDVRGAGAHACPFVSSGLSSRPPTHADKSVETSPLTPS